MQEQRPTVGAKNELVEIPLIPFVASKIVGKESAILKGVSQVPS